MKIIYKTGIVILLIICCIMIKSCKKEEVPVLLTTAITEITTTSAKSGGNIIFDGGAGVTRRGICWGVNAAPTISDSKTSEGSGPGQYVSTLSGLTPGLTYHVRAYASNSAGTGYGADLSFTTSGQSPEAITQTATNITSTGATLNATVNANNLSATITFEYGTDMSYGQTIAADQSPVTGNTGTMVTAPVSGLEPGTTWHFRVKAVNELGTTYGNDLTFSVLGQVPEVLTQSATNITSTGATLNATVNPNYLSSAISFEYGTDLSYGQTNAADQSPVTGNTGTMVSAQISGLVPGTTYHFRVKAVNELGTAYGNDLAFTVTYIVLPPSESMIIDFSNFTANKNSAGRKGTETSAWEFASAVSGVWNSLISKNLEIPITSFRFAKDYEPVYLGDSTWQWNYSFSVNSSSYKARLTGKIRTNDDYWEMYITQEGVGGFNDFLWFKGTSGSDGLEGQWVFNQSPASPVEMFSTDWTKTETLISSVKYTYLKTDTNLNSYILYGLTTGSQKASYTIHFTNGLYSDADVEWNTTDLNGRLKCADYLHDINWHCWDSNRINAVCP